MKKLRDNSFIMATMLLPFIFTLSILKLNRVLKGEMYGYLIIVLSMIFIVGFIFSLFFALDEIMNSKNKKRLFLLMLFPLFYLPIYYTKYIYKNEKYLGYIVSSANVFLITMLFLGIRTFVIDYVVAQEKKNFVISDISRYVDRNNEFSIEINNSYVCSHELGDYAISCDREEDDSFLGIYSYSKKNYSQGELDDIKSYHLEQIYDYIKESNYEYNIEPVYGGITKINYSEMSILVRDIINYHNDKMYYLIIVKEVKEENLDIFDYEKTIQNIVFLG